MTMDEFIEKIGPLVPREKTVTTPSGKTYFLRELNGAQLVDVDRSTMPDDARGLAKRVAASVVTIDGVTPTHADLTILANFGGFEMDELIRAYAEAFDPDLVARYEHTRERFREWLKHQRWLEQGENSNE